LDQNGIFMTELWAEKGIRNQYQITLKNPQGVEQELTYQEVQYTVGQTISNPPLTHSIGIATANNEVIWYFDKGDALPVNKRVFVKTSRAVKAGESEYLIRIPLIEGEKQVADRNDLIGKFEIKGHQVRRDLPVGSEVEVTIDIDESRLVRTKAYIPILDEEFEMIHTLESHQPDQEDLRDKTSREKKRLHDLKQNAEDINDPAAQRLVQEIEQQNLEEDVEGSLKAAAGDNVALDEAQSRLRDLQDAVDELENTLEWPLLLREAEEMIRSTRELLQEVGCEAEDMDLFYALDKQIQQAIDTRDADLLRRKIAQLRDHGMNVLLKDPRFWVTYLEELRGRKSSMRDQALAQEIFNRADIAVQKGDIEGLRAAVSQLMRLLPEEVQQQVEEEIGYGSTVVG
jgi:molecular chaperone DnaK